MTTVTRALSACNCKNAALNLGCPYQTLGGAKQAKELSSNTAAIRECKAMLPIETVRIRQWKN
eukprot:1145032-Pelagomonas_calceolata.AAC.3